ncbi:uroporphyrinogen-III synthase [Bacillus sp. JCM 19041]|uniref:uroporphyrinogen-III synthase n=1 Tax=Bacillus sp. JCM 19041 TaxID=1460637 RepID=UPI0006D1AADB
MKPLTGKQILVTRAKEQAQLFGSLLEEAGAVTSFLPLIDVKMRKRTSVMDKLFDSINQFDWIVFTSANGVRFFFTLFEGMLEKPLVAAVGIKTAISLKEKGVQPNLVPALYEAGALANALWRVIDPGANILVVKGQLGRQTIKHQLEKFGVHVTELIVYDTVLPEEAEQEAQALSQRCFDYATVTSASTARHLATILAEVQLDVKKIACIGPITARAAKEEGLSPLIVASEYTTEGLLQAMLKQEKGE